MSFKLSVTALAVALTSVANAQQTPSSSGAAGQELEPIVVTGSLIKSADKVGFNQVQVITASDIQATGTTTVSEFLRTIAVNSASSWADDFAYGAAGGSGSRRECRGQRSSSSKSCSGCAGG